jgi:hypothetical protein
MRKCSASSISHGCATRDIKGFGLTAFSGCDPLSPDDVAEVIVFAAGRRENVVVADTLLFPSHQVRLASFHFVVRLSANV